MQVQFHRLVQATLQPTKPMLPAAPEQITGRTPMLERDPFDLVNLTATATGIPAVHLLAEKPALQTENLLLDLTSEMAIQRGFNTAAEIRASKGRLDVDRLGVQQDEVMQRTERGQMQIERYGWNQDTLVTRRPQQVQLQMSLLNEEVNVSQTGDTIQLQRPGTEGDFTLTRNGGRTEIRHNWDSNRWLQIDQGDASVRIERPGFDQNIEIHQAGERIEIDRWGVDRDVVITQQRNKIAIDRWGVAQDSSVQISPQRIALNHFDSTQNRVVRQVGNQVTIDRGNGFDNVTYTVVGKNLEIARWSRQPEVVISGVTGSYTLQEAGMTISVTPQGLSLKSLQLDNELDLRVDVSPN